MRKRLHGLADFRETSWALERLRTVRFASFSHMAECLSCVRTHAAGGRAGAGVAVAPAQIFPPRLLSLPTRWLIRPDYGSGRSFVGGQNGHEGRCGNLHDCNALAVCCPAYIAGLAVHDVRTHADAANRYGNIDARTASGPRMRLPFFCFNPGPRRPAMIQNSRILSKGGGDNTNHDREGNRHISDPSGLQAGQVKTEIGTH